jgi:hypothetical protein
VPPTGFRCVVCGGGHAVVRARALGDTAVRSVTEVVERVREMVGLLLEVVGEMPSVFVHDLSDKG